MSIKRTLLVALTASLALVGCSDNDDKRRVSTVNVQVTAGQQDISNGLIRSSQILTTGLLDESNEGVLNFQRFYTQDNGTAIVSVLPGKLQLFELVTLPANADINQAASKSRCQWVAGCKGGKKFGDEFNPTYQWQSVVWDLRKDERVVVTPLTHLAAALAFEYAYAEQPDPDPNTPYDSENPSTQTPLWQETGYYSPYSVEQAVSQVSRLFGIFNVQTTFPADLTRINSLNSKDPISAKNSIRYGAILAAWAHLQETNAEFTENATNEFLDNNAQIMQKDAADSQVSVLTLKTIYSLAKENLEKLPVNNAGIKSLITDAVNEFDSDLTKLNAELTDTSPASIKDLFGDTAFNDYKLGVERTKLFVEDLVDGATKLIDSEYFFGKEYDTALRGYIDQQKQFFKTNKDNFNEVLKSLKSAESIYIDSYYGSDCSSSLGATLWSDCNYSGNVLTLTDDISGKQVTLSMKNVTSNKQAVDIEMTGELQINNVNNDLLFKLNDSATSKSRVRLFYSEETSQVLDSTIEPISYEYNWASFSFNNTVQEWTGNFSLLYRGVSDPTGISSEQHFNIDTLRLSSRISDHIGGTDSDVKEASSVFIAAQSSTADTYYNPDENFGKINGFFTEQSINAVQDIPGLVSYKLGEELIHNQTVKYFDFYINDESAQSFRYRFYPDVVRNQNAAGQYTVGNNDAITTHKMAVCPLSEKNGEWGVDGACSPAQVFNGKRDVQKSINALWQAGAFSYVDLPGNGEYFVEWPATKKNGCFELDKLSETAQTITEPAKLVSAAVLGLDTLRVTTEVMLEKQPRTLLDVLISAPKEDRYNVTAALSHNYSNLNEDKIFVGTGNNLDRLIFNYNTDSSFKRMGSFSVYKNGVTIAKSKVDAELMVGLNQSYSKLPHKYVTASNGGQQICVTDNEPFKGPTIDNAFDKEAVLSLTFRGVVYGSIRNERGMWIARFIDGTWIPLVP